MNCKRCSDALYAAAADLGGDLHTAERLMPQTNWLEVVTQLVLLADQITANRQKLTGGSNE